MYNIVGMVEIITDPKEVRRIVKEHFFGKAKTKNKYHAGRGADLGDVWFRSGWERNYCRVLQLKKSRGIISKWEYEPRRFYFGGYKRNPHSYLPDFRVTYPDGRIEWHEVKGYQKKIGMTALKRMALHYPQEKIVLIDAPVYQAIRRQVSMLIPYWEGER